MPLFDPDQDAHFQSWESSRVQNYTPVLSNWKTSKLCEMSIYGTGQCKTALPERNNRGEGTLQSPASLHAPGTLQPFINPALASALPPPPRAGRLQTHLVCFSKISPPHPANPACAPGSSGQTWPCAWLMSCPAWHTCPQVCLMPHLAGAGVQTQRLKKLQITAQLPCCESGTRQTPSSPH